MMKLRAPSNQIIIKMKDLMTFLLYSYKRFDGQTVTYSISAISSIFKLLINFLKVFF